MLISGDDGLRSTLGRMARAHSFVLIEEPDKAELLIWDFASTPPPGWAAMGIDHLVLIEPADAGKLAASGCRPGIGVVFKPIREADLEVAIADRAQAAKARDTERLRAERDALLQRLLGAKARSASTARGRLGPASALSASCQRAV